MTIGKIVKYSFFGLVAIAGILTIIETVRDMDEPYIMPSDIKKKAQSYKVRVHVHTKDK